MGRNGVELLLELFRAKHHSNQYALLSQFCVLQFLRVLNRDKHVQNLKHYKKMNTFCTPKREKSYNNCHMRNCSNELEILGKIVEILFTPLNVWRLLTRSIAFLPLSKHFNLNFQSHTHNALINVNTNQTPLPPHTRD